MEKRSKVEFKYHLLFNKLMPKSNDPYSVLLRSID